MDLFKSLALLFMATEATPLRLANVEFWVDAEGPWKGQLSFSIPSSKWDVEGIGRAVADLAKVYPEVRNIVLRCARIPEEHINQFNLLSRAE